MHPYSEVSLKVLLIKVVGFLLGLEITISCLGVWHPCDNSFFSISKDGVGPILFIFFTEFMPYCLHSASFSVSGWRRMWFVAVPSIAHDMLPASPALFCWRLLCNECHAYFFSCFWIYLCFLLVILVLCGSRCLRAGSSKGCWNRMLVNLLYFYCGSYVNGFILLFLALVGKMVDPLKDTWKQPE